jgi:hypothetical protein
MPPMFFSKLGVSPVYCHVWREGVGYAEFHA